MLSSQLFCLLGLLATGGLAWNTCPLLGQSFHSLLPVTRDLRERFKAFQIQYNKSYPDAAEQECRLKIFADNLARAQQLTEEHQGLAQFGVTRFSDLTGKGKNCNSCWAISAVGNVEALWAINYQQLFKLSVQELLDCRRCGQGCEGGFVWDAYMTILNQSGLAEEQDYPYRPQLSKGCQKKKKRAWIHDFLMLHKEENYMAQYLAEKGPITVTINSRLLKSYIRGVIKPGNNCDPKYVDHVVQLVGFGQIHNFTYWILKNSWGSSWGEKGYFRLHRGRNACGITKFPLTAVLKEGQTPPMRCPT
ncbi:cathepsin W [Sarcophilus harrisii]|uniref:cathepsin W n=1 Tax=Sarcophilus harrisii TaxID=9305 RepID=UPI001301FB62|nr:cathepsin W [Sarcophilus harrisii]